MTVHDDELLAAVKDGWLWRQCNRCAHYAKDNARELHGNTLVNLVRNGHQFDPARYGAQTPDQIRGLWRRWARWQMRWAWGEMGKKWGKAVEYGAVGYTRKAGHEWRNREGDVVPDEEWLDAHTPPCEMVEEAKQWMLIAKTWRTDHGLFTQRAELEQSGVLATLTDRELAVTTLALDNFEDTEISQWLDMRLSEVRKIHSSLVPQRLAPLMLVGLPRVIAPLPTTINGDGVVIITGPELQRRIDAGKIRALRLPEPRWSTSTKAKVAAAEVTAVEAALGLISPDWEWGWQLRYPQPGFTLRRRRLIDKAWMDQAREQFAAYVEREEQKKAARDARRRRVRVPDEETPEEWFARMMAGPPEEPRPSSEEIWQAVEEGVECFEAGGWLLDCPYDEKRQPVRYAAWRQSFQEAEERWQREQIS